MKKNIFIWIPVWVTLSCSSESYSKTEGTPLMIDYKSRSEIKLSDFVSDFTVIPLETADDFLVAQIDRVQLFDNKIYVLDMRSSVLFIFDIFGKFINKLDKVGQGPGEYLFLSDFVINKNGIHVLDVSSRKINRYGFDLDFMEKTAFETLGSNLMPDSSGFWLYNEPTFLPDDCQLTRIDDKGRTLASFFPRNTQPNLSYTYASANVFQKNGMNLYFSPRCGNVIYVMSNREWKPAFRLSFKDKTYVSEMDISDEDIDSDRFIFRRNFHILDDYIVIDYITGNQRYYSFYNKNTRRITSGRVKNDVVPDYERFFPQWSDGNVLIESIEFQLIPEYFPGLMKMEALKHLPPDANPVLILYRQKK
jgi:hypothetical protein